jgi:serine phosphatase RsbU (regulator of sigma subunit)
VQGTTPNATRIAIVCAASVGVFVTWISTDIGANVGLGFFYAVPIGLATWWGGPRWGAVAVAGCCALYLLGAAIQPVPDLGILVLTRFSAFLGVAVLTALVRERMIVLEHSAEELEAIRAALTPSRLPELPGVEAAAAFVPSEHGVSGDFYLVTDGPDGSTVAVVGDVVGHGPKAARLATFTRARFAAFVAGTSDPAELLMLANQALAERPRGERQLVSAACARFRAEDARLAWAAAGHPPPLRLPELEELPSRGSTFLLGASADLTLANAEVAMGAEEGVVIYTDGATDVRRQGALLGLDGLARLLSPLAGLPASTIASRAEKAIMEWADEAIRDDLCLLVLRPKDGASSV